MNLNKNYVNIHSLKLVACTFDIMINLITYKKHTLHAGTNTQM